MNWKAAGLILTIAGLTVLIVSIIVLRDGINHQNAKWEIHNAPYLKHGYDIFWEHSRYETKHSAMDRNEPVLAFVATACFALCMVYDIASVGMKGPDHLGRLSALYDSWTYTNGIAYVVIIFLIWLFFT
ncbi:hypothetical protein Ocin01_19348 [Orchesella cincta]|uniref:Uncharacterized protein n=1 Tax=Orchesella cincta TaxID=48709 RepID=A0A1D2M313_ORCCI|nr:hypothetical protein Ocin01_19348 [Orchesella cincta]